jgi:hypothetical protein
MLLSSSFLGSRDGRLQRREEKMKNSPGSAVHRVTLVKGKDTADLRWAGPLIVEGTPNPKVRK